jgi:hypothetical protein
VHEHIGQYLAIEIHPQLRSGKLSISHVPTQSCLHIASIPLQRREEIKTHNHQLEPEMQMQTQIQRKKVKNNLIHPKINNSTTYSNLLNWIKSRSNYNKFMI